MTPHAARYLSALLVALTTVTLTAGQDPQPAQQQPFEPTVGQAGKDVVWVPTSPELLEKMLDMAAITSSDFVMDLGSGDGRNVIAAAKRGARGRGVEFNPDMVALSRRLAEAAGVADKAEFVEGDMYAADVSEADALVLFLLTHNLDKMIDKFLAMKPGSRIVVNTFGFTEWMPDRRDRLEPCQSWCTVMIYIVPARIQGTWRWSDASVTISQQFQNISGTLTAAGRETAIADGKVDGKHVSFSVNGAVYAGEVDGDRIRGTIRRAGSETPWEATRTS